MLYCYFVDFFFIFAIFFCFVCYFAAAFIFLLMLLYCRAVYYMFAIFYLIHILLVTLWHSIVVYCILYYICVDSMLFFCHHTAPLSFPVALHLLAHLCVCLCTVVCSLFIHSFSLYSILFYALFARLLLLVCVYLPKLYLFVSHPLWVVFFSSSAGRYGNNKNDRRLECFTSILFLLYGDCPMYDQYNVCSRYIIILFFCLFILFIFLFVGGGLNMDTRVY